MNIIPMELLIFKQAKKNKKKTNKVRKNLTKLITVNAWNKIRNLFGSIS